MAYTNKQQYLEVVDAQDSSFMPDKSFIQAWEKYLADEDLEEEFKAFSEARSRFLGLISGSLGAEWMRQQAHWYLWAAEQEDELSLNSPPQSPSLSHSEEVMYPPVPMYGDVEEDNRTPDEALEYVEESSEEDVKDAAPASDDRDAWTQEDWDALYASQGPSCYVFTELSYLIALPDSLSSGLSFFLLISHPIHCACLVSPCDLLIRSSDVL
jgi:hypothetical protein